MYRIALLLGLTFAMLVVATACDDDDEHRLPPDDNLRQIGDQVFADHGTRDVRGQTDVSMEAGAFYFEPTFLRGNPGQTVVLTIRNEDEQNVHNFTMTEGGVVSRHIPPGGAERIEITFPTSGISLFFCGLHIEHGMRGELLVGDATPRPAP